MKLLITGAFNCTEEQKKNISDLGCEILFHKMENEPMQGEMFSVDGIICNGLFLYNDIDKFQNLRFIQLTSAGLDRVPVDIIRQKGISLCNARGVYSVPMAELALSGVLALYKHLNTFYENKKAHAWVKDRSIKELSGSKVCIVGCGSVGTECAKLFKAFETHISGADIVKPRSSIYDSFYTMDSLAEAVSDADVVVLTLPLTDETRNLFDKDVFSSCKDGAVIVNIARGSVVNEDDLINALDSGKLGGAVLDVFENEPLNSDSRLWDMENVIITPHNSFVSPKNQKRMFNVAYNNIKDFLKG